MRWAISFILMIILASAAGAMTVKGIGVWLSEDEAAVMQTIIRDLRAELKKAQEDLRERSKDLDKERSVEFECI